MSLRKLTSLIGVLVVVGQVVFILFSFLKTNDQPTVATQNDSVAETDNETSGVLSEGAVDIASQSEHSKLGVEIVDSGFGQDSSAATVNFLGESGAVVAIEDQKEKLSW